MWLLCKPSQHLRHRAVAVDKRLSNQLLFFNQLLSSTSPFVRDGLVVAVAVAADNRLNFD